MHYVKKKLIGRGANGDVFLAQNCQDGSVHVIKRLQIRGIPERQRITIQTELRLLKEFKHVNIVPFRDSYIDVEGSLNIVMAYCEGGDMHKLIEEAEGKKFPEKQIVDWIIQLALSIFYLHERRILHRDIKTQNIFLTEGRIMLGDFGVSKVLDQAADLARTNIGTPYYMSPEQYRQKPYSYKSDIWAFGCIIYEMCNHKHVFEAMSINALAVKVMKGAFAPVSECYSQNLRSLVEEMLSQNPKKRPSIIEILKKPFLAKKVRQYMRDVLDNSNRYESEQIQNLKAQAKSLGFSLQQEPKKKTQNTPTKSVKKTQSKFEKSKEKLKQEREKKFQELSEKLRREIDDRNKAQEKLKEFQKGNLSSRQNSSEKQLSSGKKIAKKSARTPNQQYFSVRESPKEKLKQSQEIVHKGKEKQKAKIEQEVVKNFKMEEEYDMDYEEYSEKEEDFNKINEEEQEEQKAQEIEEQKFEEKEKEKDQRENERWQQEQEKSEGGQESKQIQREKESRETQRQSEARTSEPRELLAERSVEKKDHLEKEVKQKTIMISNIRNQMSKLDFIISSDSESEGEKQQKKEYNPAYTRISERMNDLKQKIIAQLGRNSYATFLQFIEKTNGKVSRPEVIKVVGEHNIGVWHIADNIVKLDKVLQKIPMYTN